MPRAEPQRFYGPPRSFSRRTEPQQWRPYTRHDPRWPDAGNSEAKEPIPGTGDHGFFQEEARQWLPSAYPVGTDMKIGRRGGLTGQNPEALCGEAPKGQPKIRRETLEAVCVEAPQGQPRNHRPQNQHMSRPKGEITGTQRG